MEADNESAICVHCGGTLYVRGLFYVDEIPLTKEGSEHLISPTDGTIQDADEELEVYCSQCDFTMSLDEHAKEK